MDRKIIAHVRSLDSKEQTLEQHLFEVSAIAGRLANKINMMEAGQLLGLMHDFGKYSEQFQSYIQSATGLLNPDLDEDYVDSHALKGKIDHSSAGAQWVWEKLRSFGAAGQGQLCGQILSLCIASHHSGLIDCLKPDGKDGFQVRMRKPEDKAHLKECKENSNKLILEQANKLADKPLLKSMINQINQFISEQQHNTKISEKILHFYMGFWTRFLFSCLIDADRINSADFERPHNSIERSIESPVWDIAIERFERFINGLDVHDKIDVIRRDISDYCKLLAERKQGIYSLTVPTGGGKTFSSLRFALHHAKSHHLDRIIYVIPYTSIIEQNAEAVRNILERDTDLYPWVLEHHSNLEPEQQTWRSKLVSENWDSPVVFTTMVQFLETLFSGGTRGVRRLHQLAKSVVIFDEIQTLPINCTHMFCNAINFLSTYAQTTAVLCTATQPLLDKLINVENGQLIIPAENELVKNKAQLFADLERVKINNAIKNGGWSADEIIQLMLDEYHTKGSCLIIVNTKVWAKRLFELSSMHIKDKTVFHLSTNQCPAHRKQILNTIRARLHKGLPILCISTQLIEAGVDIDFASVIRFLAGLDSIAQAAGRCNRNGRSPVASVYVINPHEENVDLLVDIKEGKEVARRVFAENDDELLSPEIMQQYFNYYFYARADDMSYTLTKNETGRTDTLLNLISDNKINPAPKNSLITLRQSFMTAGRAFKAIDAPTESVIVPFGDGKQLITDLCAVAKEFNPSLYYRLLKNAQKFTVNVFPNVWSKLVEQQAVHEIQVGEGIYYLDEEYYSDNFGLSIDAVEHSPILVC